MRKELSDLILELQSIKEYEDIPKTLIKINNETEGLVNSFFENTLSVNPINITPRLLNFNSTSKIKGAINHKLIEQMINYFADYYRLDLEAKQKELEPNQKIYPASYDNNIKELIEKDDVLKLKLEEGTVHLGEDITIIMWNL